MKIGIIIGSTRDNRMGRAVGEWVAARAQVRTDAEFELVDLADFDVPLLTTAVPPAALNGNYQPDVQPWADKIGEFDAFVFVTPEYNHGVPGVFKNAVDQVGVEWMKKAVAFVGYGYGGGIMAIENWRTIVANFSMYDIRETVAINLATDVHDGQLSPAEFQTGAIKNLFDSLVPAAQAMSTLR